MKSCFVLWSAGLDSTYLIIRLLKKGFRVTAAYVDIRNNYTKGAMERQALEKLVPQIEAQFSNFEYQGTIFSGANSSIDSYGIKYKQIPYFLHALLIAPHTDCRAIGYVKGDSSIKNLEKIRTVYNTFGLIHNGDLPSLVFPLKNTSKGQIFHYMNSTYPSIVANCVWCERPVGDSFTPCTSCKPCLRRSRELHASMQGET